MRLYYGRLLRAMRYSPAYGDKPARFLLQLVKDTRMVGVYEAPTIDGILEQVRADGHQVWGADDPLNYALPPMNGLEYVLAESLLRERGLAEEEIERCFSFRE